MRLSVVTQAKSKARDLPAPSLCCPVGSGQLPQPVTTHTHREKRRGNEEREQEGIKPKEDPL